MTDVLDKAGLAYEIYSDIKANPTIENVQYGVAAFKAAKADYIVAVVGTAMIGIQGFVVGATPSRLLTSSNSGFAMIIPIAFAVSIEEPPPIATM